ncbi:MAG: DUF1376 domain-containing protein [Pseudomonadota bacterium]
MTALPSMPLFVDDYEAAAAHLTLEEDGAYNRLLRLCWRMPDCSVPDDPVWIARYLRVDTATYERLVAPLIAEFFTRAEGRVFQKRQVKEFRYVTDLVAKRRRAGKRGGEAKARKLRGERDGASTASNPAPAYGRHPADGGPPPRPTPRSIPMEESESSDQGGSTSLAGEETPPNRKRGRRLAEDWQPTATDRGFAAKEGLSDGEIERTADRFRDYWTAKSGAGAVKRDWAATWRNWVRTDGDRRRATTGPGPTSKDGVAERSGPGCVTEAAFRVLAGLRDDPDLSR